jgi:hypothetical protein
MIKPPSLASNAPERSDGAGRLTLHDLQFDYVRGKQRSLPGLHNRLLNAYAAQCTGGWATGPNDGYFQQHLIHHLIQG